MYSYVYRLIFSDPHLTNYLEEEFLDEQVIEDFSWKLFMQFVLFLGQINQGIR